MSVAEDADHRHERERVLRDQIGCRRPSGRRPCSTRPANPPACSANRVMCVGADVRYRCATTTSPVPAERRERRGGGRLPPGEIAIEAPPDPRRCEQGDGCSDVRARPRRTSEQPDRGDQHGASRMRQPLRHIDGAAEEQADEGVRQTEVATAVELRSTEERCERCVPSQDAFDDSATEQERCRRRRWRRGCPTCARSGTSASVARAVVATRNGTTVGVGQRREMPHQQQRQRHERQGDRDPCAERAVAGETSGLQERNDRDQARETHVESAAAVPIGTVNRFDWT